MIEKENISQIQNQGQKSLYLAHSLSKGEHSPTAEEKSHHQGQIEKDLFLRKRQGFDQGGTGQDGQDIHDV